MNFRRGALLLLILPLGDIPLEEERRRPAAPSSLPSLPSMAFYPANLHSHTRYSDGGHLGHAGTDRPLSAFRAAARAGLRVMAVTDHAEDLTAEEWSRTREHAERATTPEFAALRGFEWTHTYTRSAFRSGLLRWIPHPTHLDRGAGHMTVFASEERVRASGASADGAEVRRELGAFYRWLADGERTALDGGPLVAQFNHPTTYDNTSHFDAFALPGGEEGERLREVCALLEMGSLVAERYEGGATFGEPLRKARHAEYWLRQALARGWRVAPAASEDNHGGHYGEGLVRHPRRSDRMVYPRTGVYAAALTPRAVLEALRRRRVFSSEDRHAALRLLALPDGEREWRWMGEVLENGAADGGITLHLRVEGRDPLQAVQVVGPGGREWDVPLPEAGAARVETTFRLDAGRLTQLPRSARGERYFYARVFQKDRDMLYSAPVWIR